MTFSNFKLISSVKGLFFLLFIIPIIAVSQTRQPTLQEINADYQELRKAAEVRILNYLKNNPQERVVNFKNGGVRLLVNVNANGVPEYIKTFNAQEAATLNVPALRTGGSLGINVLGTGMKLGIWDGGPVRNDHVELVGRVTQANGTGAFSDHATHVSGTMLASGVNPEAKGMAPEATLIAFDFDNDVSEMANQARPDQTSLILSNHSYGSVCGWDQSANVWRGDPAVSNSFDYRFGFYDASAAQFDAIAFGAPYYTIVKAAGNDRGDSGTSGPQAPDGPFDCIPTNSVAKNIITVGAIQNLTSYTQPSDVLPTNFSSWGPTDDGRIKPDIVAPGFNVFSLNAKSPTGYEFESGTSMSTPATTGTLALLQQLYKSLNSGNYMRSATLKALVLHTAREAGSSPGPDYSYGWGLLDAEAAAKIIINKDNQNIFIKEQVLINGQTFEIDLGTPKTGTKITATLVWTDPAGTPPPVSLNPTNKMLVNDLDLKLVDDGNNTQLPWTLNPATPNAAAVAGDNIRDNVEKIELASSLSRNYKLRVTNKGTLQGGLQAFSLIVEYSSLVDPRTTYYWIGNDGAWSDGSHWSLSSGGAAANAVPGANDRVVFNEQSFTATSTITLNADQSCYSLRWFGNQFNVGFSLNAHTLTVGEGLTLLSTKITTPTTGNINFNSAATTANAVDLSSNNLDKWSLLFNGDSSWAVTGSATVDKITIAQGSVGFNGSSIHLNQLVPSGAGAKSVSFTTSSTQGAAGNLLVDFTGMTVQSDISSSIVGSPATTHTVNLSSANYQGILSLNGGDISVTGTNTVRSIQGNGIIRLNGSLLVSNLNLTGGSQMILQQGSTQTFTDKITFSTSSTSRVKILSSGTNATFALSDYFKICLDFVDVTNVDVTGTSIVNAGAGSTLTNSANWLKANCTDILFPDFAVTYTCIKSSTYFTDKSSGSITSRIWSFGDPASGTQNSSTLVSPLHYYTSAGPFTATLTVTGPAGSRPLSKTITLTANDLAENTVALNGTSLISTVVANSYQWLKDGQLVSGATSRSYGFGGTSAVYSVLTFSTTCNKRSDPYTLTGVEDSPSVAGTKVKIYPNPTADILQLESANPITAASIMDAVGREFSMGLEEVSKGRYRMNVSSIPSGLYVLKTLVQGKVDLQKIIIRK